MIVQATKATTLGLQKAQPNKQNKDQCTKFSVKLCTNQCVSMRVLVTYFKRYPKQHWPQEATRVSPFFSWSDNCLLYLEKISPTAWMARGNKWEAYQINSSNQHLITRSSSTGAPMNPSFVASSMSAIISIADLISWILGFLVLLLLKSGNHLSRGACYYYWSSKRA